MSDAAFDLVDAEDGFTNTAWFRHCRDTGAPYVLVRRGETSADVLWDFVTLAPGCDALLLEKHSTLAEAACAIFDRYAAEDSHLRVKTTTIAFDRLPLAHATSAATELQALIAEQIVACAGAPAPVRTGRPTPSERAAEPVQRTLWVETMTASNAA